VGARQEARDAGSPIPLGASLAEGLAHQTFVISSLTFRKVTFRAYVDPSEGQGQLPVYLLGAPFGSGASHCCSDGVFTGSGPAWAQSLDSLG
jgi:hypothetical protein